MKFKEALENRKFYYIVIDQLKKTAQVAKSDDCIAVTEKAIRKIYTNFKLIWNHQCEDFTNLPKKYEKYKKIDDILIIDSKSFRLAKDDEDIG